MKLFCWTILAILCFSLFGLPCLAQGRSPQGQFPLLNPRQQEPTELKPGVPPRSTRQGPTDPQEAAAFFDQFYAQEMNKEHVPGAVVALVKDGKILFTKGYGHANVDKQTPVAPDTTLFRVASLSKLFTDTGVMQLYERGLLDLDQDVNQYLKDFQIENNYPEPITATHLMTQTDGTSQRLLGIAAPTAPKMLPLAEFIPKRMPAIVQPPGTLYAYSNMGVTLAGYLVQTISGTPFEQYIDKNILQPLDMSRSSFLQPLPPPLKDDLAQGYRYQNGSFKPVPFLYFNIAPAAALSATATDMAHFMIAHLQHGRYENSRILEEDTAQLMHQTHFTQHPKLPGTAYGFHERLQNNIRAIGHLGNSLGYSSSLTLLPEQNVGLFTATNSLNGLQGKIIGQFFDHYYPVVESPMPQTSTAFADQADRFTGTYRDLDYPRDTFIKLTAPFGHYHVKASDRGRLTVHSPGLFWLKSQIKRRLVPLEPLLFQQPNHSGYVAFGEDSRGPIAYAFNLVNPVIGSFEKIPWYKTAGFQLGLLGFYTVLFLSAVIVWPGSYLIRRLRRQHWRSVHPLRMAWMVAGLTSAFYLVFLIGVPLLLWLIGAWKLIYGVPALVVPFFYLPPLAVGLTIALPIFTLLAWKNKHWSLFSRLHYSLVTLAAIAFIPFLLYWNLLGLQF